MEQKIPPVATKRIDLSLEPLVKKTRNILTKCGLNTICDSGCCPNLNECYGRSTATIMIMGDVCTRDCRFCSVKNGQPLQLDESEPGRVAEAVKKLNLKYVVITSVTRDDQDSHGVFHFVETINEVRALNPGTVIEVLVPDFGGVEDLVEILVDARPDVIGHNLETIARLHWLLRPNSSYYRSLTVLDTVKNLNPEICTKSGIMLGLGENENDVIEVMRDLKKIKCDILILGQYLQPTKKQVEVKRYVTEEEFERYREIAGRMDFSLMAVGTFVRSSYKASEYYEQFIKNKEVKK